MVARRRRVASPIPLFTTWMSNVSISEIDQRLQKIQEEDEHALSLAESHGFVIRRTIQHRAHLQYARRCRERGVPCICVYLRRGVADITLDMPRGPAGWRLDTAAQDAVRGLIRQTACAAYNVGPARVACCRLPVAWATELAQRLHAIAMAARPADGP
jgi:hypothetical protein